MFVCAHTHVCTPVFIFLETGSIDSIRCSKGGSLTQKWFRTTDREIPQADRDVPGFRRLNNLVCEEETKRAMPLGRSTKEPEPEDELLTYVNEFSPYRVQTKYIMDEPVIKWASQPCQLHS